VVWSQVRHKEAWVELIIRSAETAWPDAQDVEVVERKGIGHPDTICDALAEEIC
jgi:S-adenosylmethionine synthetase